jgi:hypothetical protein
MTNTARAHLVKQGNTWTVRILRRLLERAGLGREIVLEARLGQIVVRPPLGRRHPRQGWDEQFAAMAERGHDRLLDPW